MSKLKIGLVVLSAIVVFSCKKKNDDSALGLDVQPESDLLGITVSDSSMIYMHTQKVDSVRSYPEQYKYLGSVQDPEFGRMDASIYTNYSIANNLTSVSFGANPVLDSAEMVIPITGQFLGDTTSILNYEIHLLNSKLVSGTSYYTNQTIPYASSNVASGPGKYRVRGTSLCLVIPLDRNMAQHILETESDLTNNTAFQNANKGFYITTSGTNLSIPGSGAIRRFDLDNDVSGVNLYYHDGNSTSSKGQSFQFSFRGSDALRFNHIDHNYASGANQNLYDQLTGDTIKGSSHIYLNSFGGTRVRVYLPFIKQFADSQHVSISRAELILKIEGTAGSNPYFGFPSSLALIGCSASGAEELVFDQINGSDLQKYNGTYNSTDNTYTFNIARQVQKIISNNLYNYGFYLVNAQPVPAYTIQRDNRLERVVFGGKNNIAYQPVFKVTYVKYPYDK